VARSACQCAAPRLKVGEKRPALRGRRTGPQLGRTYEARHAPESAPNVIFQLARDGIKAMRWYRYLSSPLSAEDV